MCLPVGGLGYSSERVRVNGCAYQLVGLDTVLSECGLPVGGLGYSSEQVRLDGCAYQLVGLDTVDTVLSGCASTGVLTSWWAWVQF